LRVVWKQKSAGNKPVSAPGGKKREPLSFKDQGFRMKKRREKYLVDSVDLFPLRNRNETRVAECIQEILDSLKDEFFSDKAIQDIYAYSLNQLPARYAQAGTIVLNDPVRKADIRKVVRAAFDFVAENPKE
jgi:hypothetical protein